jgi:transcriptional regulator with GAF, ATPase, and Fis domain
MQTTQSHPLIAHSAAMRSILSAIDTIKDSESSVLLIGETGVGKELLGEYVHRVSTRHDRPLVKVGLSALPHELMESELFGHERGAYTSAGTEKRGLFEFADGGSILLDDIDDLPLPLQSKLLRVLEAREVKRVGGVASIPIDVRVITTTKVDLREMVERGSFRADLYYRINVIPITIPPLRHRREDIPYLVGHFLSRYASGRQIHVAPDAAVALESYSWPGNVRELRNVIQRAALFCANNEIHVSNLSSEITGETPLEHLLKSCGQCVLGENASLDHAVSCLEKNLIRHALKQAGGNQTEAARMLKVKPSTLRDKIKKYTID